MMTRFLQRCGGAEEMVKDLKANVFPTREVHYLAVNKDGKQVRTI